MELRHLLKPGAKLRDWKNEPMTEAELSALKLRGEAIRKARQDEKKSRLSQKEVWLNLHRPMDI